MKNYSKKLMSVLLALCLVLSFAACSSTPAETDFVVDDEIAEAAFKHKSEEILINIEDEAVALAGDPAISSVLTPVASGSKTSKGNNAVIDYSNAADGYIMVKYTTSSSQRLKVQVQCPTGITYTYDLASDDQYDVYPLSEGNGSYKVTVFKNVQDTSYSTVHSTSIDVKLTDEFAPFLMPNQYVNYNENTLCVKKAQELTSGMTDMLAMVEEVYSYVVENFKYDTAKASSVQSGYLPDLDEVFKSNTGICFDYAAVMAAMLRSINIPTKLVIGYSGSVYHAWINVYSDESGWISGAIFFDGTTWKLMDPTFASSGNQSSSVMQYIGNASNYTAQYAY